MPGGSRALAGLLLLLWAGTARGEEPACSCKEPEQKPAPATPEPKQPSLDDTMAAGEADAVEPARKLVKWNEYEGPWFRIRVGGGLLLDSVAYSQNTASEEQFDLVDKVGVRDFRVLLKGSFPKFERVSWSAGIMYDGYVHHWLIRETGVMLAVPEIGSWFFVGRTKEGIPLNKVMTGYAGWTLERAPINDALVPILADGIKWLGYLPEHHVLWNLGLYVDWLSQGQAFSTYSHQVVGRVAWLPLAAEKAGTLLHLGASFRYGHPEDNQLRLRSRPEAFLAPYVLDTGTFRSSQTYTGEVEAYFRPGSWLFGTEYFVQRANSSEAGNPISHGGSAIITWIVTGETRAYNTRGGFFDSVSPFRTVLEGGTGAWDVGVNFTYTDLDGGTLQGGRFWRVSPIINWYLSDHLRLEFEYGYGVLDRFDLKGGTFFFQNRIQMQL